MRSASRKLLVILMTTGSMVVCVAAASANELPEFTNVPGKFTGTAGTSEFAWRSAHWAYKQIEISGEFTTAKTARNITIKFTAGPNGCNTEGTNLVWSGLNGRLGYINKEKHEIGLLFEPPTQPIVKCKDKVLGVEEYRGHIIARFGPNLRKTNTFEVRFSVSGSKQNPLAFEGEKAEALELCSGFCNELDVTTLAAEEISIKTERETELLG